MDHPERARKKLRPKPDDRCLICKKVFVKKTAQNTMCSDECRRVRAQQISKRWYAEHRAEHIAKVERQRQQRTGKKPAAPAQLRPAVSKPKSSSSPSLTLAALAPPTLQLHVPIPQTLIVLQGLPGSGKTTLARMIASCTGAIICSTDDYHIEADGVYRYKANYAQDFHRKNQLRAAELLKAGKSVIVDNTNMRNWEASHYVKEARKLRVPCQFISVSGPFESCHCVPAATMARMKESREILSLEACLAT